MNRHRAIRIDLVSRRPELDNELHREPVMAQGERETIIQLVERLLRYGTDDDKLIIYLGDLRPFEEPGEDVLMLPEKHDA